MAIYSQLLRGQRVGMDKMVVGKAPGRENQTGIDVTAAIFFDGTGNNRNNVAQRRMVEHNATHPDNPLIEEEGVQLQPAGYEKYGRNKEGKPKDSYEAGYSNVSILERMNLERVIANRAISLYVEGIGTQNNLGDDKPGNMFGIFKTGIKNKVQIGIGRLAESIAEVLENQENAQVERLIINVFGFSRGSTEVVRLVWTI